MRKHLIALFCLVVCIVIVGEGVKRASDNDKVEEQILTATIVQIE